MDAFFNFFNMSKNLIIQELIETIKVYNLKGWSPATSTNYSFIDEKNQMWISRSGIDKGIISEIDFIPIDQNGLQTGNNLTFKPSAETAIHLTIYKLFPLTKIILHSHGIYPVLLSYLKKNYFEFQENEIQKGFDGEASHLSKLRIPLLENSQDMSFFEKELWTRKSEILHSSLAISKHGTYAWGKNLFEAKRHLETLDYLCQLEWNLIQK